MNMEKNNPGIVSLSADELEKVSGGVELASSVTGADIVGNAYNCLGKPYEWGACGPDSFDASGLVCFCLGCASHVYTTATFMGWPQVSDPQPGDIVTNDSYCGIYIGSEQMIYAPKPGDVVKIGNVQPGMIIVRQP